MPAPFSLEAMMHSALQQQAHANTAATPQLNGSEVISAFQHDAPMLEWITGGARGFVFCHCASCVFLVFCVGHCYVAINQLIERLRPIKEPCTCTHFEMCLQSLQRCQTLRPRCAWWPALQCCREPRKKVSDARSSGSWMT